VEAVATKAHYIHKVDNLRASARGLA